MKFDHIMRLAAAIPLLAAMPALAMPYPGSDHFQRTGIVAPADAPRAPVRLAQAGDPDTIRLEEQIRDLAGRVEELNFQILQMQDQMQRMQEDNEFRFQELEGGDSTGTGPDAGERDEGRAPEPEADPSNDFAALPGDDTAGDEDEPGSSPREFGTIVFNADGSIRDTTIGDGAVGGGEGGGRSDSTTVAALPQADSAEELYRNSYEFVLSGDYSTAEAGFRDLIDRFPDSSLQPDASFWLGEALLAQERPREAAEVFLAASRDYPESSKAPEILYKLGVSLVSLDQREVACATFAEVGNRFPDAPEALRSRVSQEQEQASC